MKKILSILATCALMLTASVPAFAATNYNSKVISALQSGFCVANNQYTLPPATIQQAQTYLNQYNLTQAQADKIVQAISAADGVIANSVGQTGTDLKNLPTSAQKTIHTILSSAAFANQIFSTDGTNLIIVDANGSQHSIAIPVLVKSTASAKIDTGKQLNVEQGKTYQFEITSSSKPTFVCGNGSVFKIVYSGSKGNNYFFKATAVGSVGSCTGFYVNGEKIARTIATVIAPTVASDTGKSVKIYAGKTYQFKLTSSVKPRFVCGNGSTFKIVYCSSKGNDYFYKVIAIGKKGACAGLYINNEKTPRTIATIG